MIFRSATRRSTPGAAKELIDTGQLAGTTSREAAELVAGRQRIAELAAHHRAAELLKEAVPPKGRYAAIATMAA